jgi:hypothetical protein
MRPQALHRIEEDFSPKRLVMGSGPPGVATLIF